MDTLSDKRNLKKDRKKERKETGEVAYMLVHNLEAMNSFPRNHVEN